MGQDEGREDTNAQSGQSARGSTNRQPPTCRGAS